MLREGIWVLFRCIDYEYFSLWEESLFIELPHYDIEYESQKDRIYRRKNPYIEYDESRNRLIEEISRRQIDESDIEKEPYHWTIYRFTQYLYHRTIRTIAIESRESKDHSPEYHSCDDKGDKCIGADIGDTQLYEWDTIGDRSQSIAREKYPDDSEYFDQKGCSWDDDITPFHDDAKLLYASI